MRGTARLGWRDGQRHGLRVSVHVRMSVCASRCAGGTKRRHPAQPGWGESRKHPDEGYSLAGAVGSGPGVIQHV